MNPGRLRHRVQIQQHSTGQSASGAVVDTWTTLATVWASVQPLLGREFWQARQENAVVSTKIRMRWNGVLQPRHRIVHAGRWFDVVSVALVDDIQHELVVMANERVEVPL